MEPGTRPASAVPIFALTLPAVLAAAIVGLPLFQDGASYLFEILMTGSAVRHHRLSVRLIQLPALLVHRWAPGGDGIAFVRTAFTLGYALVPLVALALSWAVVRRTRPGLVVWPGLVILFVNLVDFSWVSELLIAMQLAWPLALAWIVAPGAAATIALTLLLLPVIWWLHPLAAALLASVGAACAVVAWRDPTNRRAAIIGAATHVLAAAARVLATPLLLSSYEAGFLEPPELVGYLFVSHWENVVVLGTALAIAALVAWPHASGAGRARYAIGTALAAGAALVFAVQFAAPHHTFPLKTGLALLTSITLVLLAAFDAGTPTATRDADARVRLTGVLAAVFAAVIGAKCVAWHAATARLQVALAVGDARCRETDTLDWLHTAPYSIIDNWALPSLALVMQDRPPRRLLLAPGDCAQVAATGTVQIDPWTTLPAASLVPPLD